MTKNTITFDEYWEKIKSEEGYQQLLSFVSEKEIKKCAEFSFEKDKLKFKVLQKAVDIFYIKFCFFLMIKKLGASS